MYRYSFGPRKLTNLFLSTFIIIPFLVFAGPAISQDKITIGNFANPNHFHPYDFEISAFTLFNQFYNVLVRLDEQTIPRPELATYWELAEDGTSITLWLRRGVKFQTGREFVAEDVKRTHARATHPDTFANSKPLFKSITEVKILDRYKVQLVFEGPNPLVFDLLDQLWIINDDVWDKHSTEPVGTGPFELVEYRAGDKIVIRRFDQYWRKTGGSLVEVEFRIIPDLQAVLLQLESGDTDATGYTITPRQAQRLESKGIVVDVATEMSFYNVMFNTKSGRFADRRMRQAFNYAIDRDRFVRIVLAGKSTPMCMPWKRSSFAFDQEMEASCEYNLDTAKQMFAAAGFPSGSEFTLVTSTNYNPALTKLAEIIQNDMTKAGFNVKVEDLDSPEYIQKHNNLGFEVIMSGTGRINRDPSNMLNATITFRAEGNAAGYHNPRYIELNNRAKATVDPEERKQLFQEMSRIIQRDLYTTPVASQSFLFAYNPKLKGIRYSVDGFLFLEDVTVD